MYVRILYLPGKPYFKKICENLMLLCGEVDITKAVKTKAILSLYKDYKAASCLLYKVSFDR